MFPESFQILASSVGVQDRRVGSMIPSRNLYVETGIIRKVSLFIDVLCDGISTNAY